MYLRSPRLCAAGLGFKPRVLLAPELVLAPPYQKGQQRSCWRARKSKVHGDSEPGRTAAR